MAFGMNPENGHMNGAQGRDFIQEEDGSIRVLHIEKEDRRKDFDRILSALIGAFDFAGIVHGIENGADYIVQIPSEFQKALQDNAVELLHGKESGQTWATLARRLPSGKYEFVCNCPIVKRAADRALSLHHLMEWYQKQQMQSKLDQLSEQVKDAYDAVLRIEQGQMDDRIGKLISGRDDIQRAIKNPNPEERRREMELARSKVSEAQGQVGQVFKSRVEAFEDIPGNVWARRWRELITASTSYMTKRDEEFDKLQDCFALYLRATQLLGWTYTLVEDTERASMVFRQAADFLKCVDYSHVKTLDALYPGQDMSEAFYHQPGSYIEAEEEFCLEACRPCDCIQISLTGEEMKGAIGSGAQTI